VPVAGTGIITADKTLPDCAALDGKPLALPVATGIYPTLLNKYLAEHCNNAKPQILILPDIKARFTGLQNGTLVASLMQRDDLVELEKQAPGKFTALIPLNGAYPDVITNGLQVNTDYAQANPELVHDLVYALVAANREATTNPTVYIEDAINRLKLDPAFAKASVEGNVRDKLWDLNGGLTTTNVQYTLDFLSGLGSLPQGIKVEDVADVSFIDRVLAELGRK
jgi:hypothetical protein